MVEKYEPIPFKDRPSQNIGLSHYWHEIAPILGITALGAVMGWGASKAKLIKATPGIAAVFGGKLTGIVSAFMIWKKKEKALVSVEEVYKQIESIEGMHHTDDDLKRDNRMLAQMIEHEKRKQEKLRGSFTERLTDDAVKTEQAENIRNA